MLRRAQQRTEKLLLRECLGGDDIADLGGAFIAYEAFMSSDDKKATQDKWTAEQRFFLAYGQSFCHNARAKSRVRSGDTNDQRLALVCFTARTATVAAVLSPSIDQGRRLSKRVRSATRAKRAWRVSVWYVCESMIGERTQSFPSIGAEGGGSHGRAAPALTLLHYARAEREGTQVPLTGPIIIGRKAEADVVLGIEADHHASRRHAVVAPGGAAGEAWVEDLGSRNGTFVDGVRVRRQQIRYGAVIRVGSTLFEFAPVERHAQDPKLDEGVVGRSASFLRAWRESATFAQANVAVLITGESGSGKEILAAHLHRSSARRGRFVALNCAAIPEALFEATLFGYKRGAFTNATVDNDGLFSDAENGTLFLDELGELPLALQSKLLRVLETGEFHRLGSSATLSSNARIVAATNADLQAKMRSSAFRQDLYARLATTTVRVPPLRERRLDILPLAKHLAQTIGVSAELDWSSAFVERLLVYPWPLNVRELRAVVQRLGLLRRAHPDESPVQLFEQAQMMSAEPVEEEPAVGRQPRLTIDEATLREALSAHEGNVHRVAVYFGRERKQIYLLIKRFGLNLDDFRSAKGT